MSKDNQIQITLTNDEALVLFEILSRFTSQTEDIKSLELTDKSEKIALWNELALLEKILSEPFSDNYGERLMQAKQNLLGTV